MMATQIRLQFISEGFKEILTGAGVQSAVREAARAIQARANANAASELDEDSDGYSARTWLGGYGGGRWVGSVSTTDHSTMVAEAENKALSRAVST
jgi:hypothetical protein